MLNDDDDAAVQLENAVVYIVYCLRAHDSVLVHTVVYSRRFSSRGNTPAAKAQHDCTLPYLTYLTLYTIKS